MPNKTVDEIRAELDKEQPTMPPPPRLGVGQSLGLGFAGATSPAFQHGVVSPMIAQRQNFGADKAEFQQGQREAQVRGLSTLGQVENQGRFADIAQERNDLTSRQIQDDERRAAGYDEAYQTILDSYADPEILGVLEQAMNDPEMMADPFVAAQIQSAYYSMKQEVMAGRVGAAETADIHVKRLDAADSRVHEALETIQTLRTAKQNADTARINAQTGQKRAATGQENVEGANTAREAGAALGTAQLEHDIDKANKDRQARYDVALLKASTREGKQKPLVGDVTAGKLGTYEVGLATIDDTLNRMTTRRGAGWRNNLNDYLRTDEGIKLTAELQGIVAPIRKTYVGVAVSKNELAMISEIFPTGKEMNVEAFLSRLGELRSMVNRELQGGILGIKRAGRDDSGYEDLKDPAFFPEVATRRLEEGRAKFGELLGQPAGIPEGAEFLNISGENIQYTFQGKAWEWSPGGGS